MGEKAVKQWFVYASRDLRVAKHTLAFDSMCKNIAAFLAQQSAEKAIKGFLVFHRVRFHKTHNFEELSAAVGGIDPTLAKLIHKRKSMTKFAVTYRYPSSAKRALTLAEVKTAIKNAEEIYDECFRRVYGAK